MTTQPRLDGTDVLPEAFVARWRERSGGEPLREVFCEKRVGRWWMVVEHNRKTWAMCSRFDLIRAADDLYEWTRP